MSIFTFANIINIHDGSIKKGHVLVKDGLIEAVYDTTVNPKLRDVQIIDAQGKYLLPGLAEMHAHVPNVEWNDPKMKETLFLYLSNGVTTIRGMLGQPSHLELRSKAEENSILSPRIYTSSPSLNGNTVTTPKQAREKVTAYQADGYDFLKLHPGIRKHVFDEIVKTAHEVGIPYAGHVSNLVGIDHALKNQYASVDHVDGFLEGLVPASAEVNPLENGFFGYNFTLLADPNRIPELVQLAKDNKVWVVPTQALFDRWFSPIPSQVLVGEPEMQYISPDTREAWSNSKDNLIDNLEFNAAQWAQFNQIRFQLIKALHNSGQGLLLGSDAPQVFNVPGFSIHHELDGMIRAGLSPLEALQIGTLNPAKFFGKEGEFGEITEGASADMILVDNNPLDDLAHLKDPQGVMVKGQWLSRNYLHLKLKEIAKAYRED